VHWYAFSRICACRIVISIQDLALKAADRTGADYVLAQDPDSDRFSAAEKRYDPLVEGESDSNAIISAVTPGWPSPATNSA
jgi:hypothetical protein